MSGCSSRNRREFLGSAALLGTAVSLTSGPLRAGSPAAAGTVLRPEDFGARGDGRTDDTAAFQALGRAVSEQRGGTISMQQGATYRVGRQIAALGAGAAAYHDQPMLLISGADGVIIQGNGATLKLNDGLYFGSFDPGTGHRFDPPGKARFTIRSYARVVGKLLEIVDSVNVRIVDLTLDGNMDRLVVGGRWGDVEIQLPATGLQLTRVSRVTVENVTCRNNGLDGIYVSGRNTGQAGGPSDDIVFRHVRSDCNGRQGMSVVGGKGLRFESCTFANTGQGKLSSRPNAGVDIEPNGRNWATDLAFVNCTFLNNRQVGLLADAGNSHTIRVTGCTFWQGFAAGRGTTIGSGDAFWITKDETVIERCQVHGNVTNLAPSVEVRSCSFDDDVHPLYGRSAQRRPYLMAQAAGQFTDCRFEVTGGGGRALIIAKAPLTLQHCRLVFGGTGLPARRAVAFFAPTTTLNDVTISLARSAARERHYVYGGGARLLGQVSLGSGLHWNSTTGPVGIIGPKGNS